MIFFIAILSQRILGEGGEALEIKLNSSPLLPKKAKKV